MEIDELPGQLLQLKRRQNLNSQESGAQSNPELGTLMKARKPEILILGQSLLESWGVIGERNKFRVRETLLARQPCVNIKDSLKALLGLLRTNRLGQ